MDAYTKQVVGGLICTVADIVITVDTISDILEANGLATEPQVAKIISRYREVDSYKELIALGTRLIAESQMDAGIENTLMKAMKGELSDEEMAAVEKLIKSKYSPDKS